MTPVTPVPASDEAAWRVAWEDALTALELDVDSVERMLASLHDGRGELVEPTGSWTPPVVGPLPESLRERAQLVLARQLRVMEDVAHAAVRSRQHLEVQRRMRPDDATSRPLFVDAAF
ncbi:hypothetical protein GCM10027446_22970 [Angustibacter peucedani]